MTGLTDEDKGRIFGEAFTASIKAAKEIMQRQSDPEVAIMEGFNKGMIYGLKKFFEELENKSNEKIVN